MRTRPLLALLGSLALCPDLGAQLPGESIYGRRIGLRAEYLEVTFRQVSQSLQQWTKAVERRDERAIRRSVAEDLLFVPLDGALTRGREAQDSLIQYARRISALGLAPFDFDASGAIASVYAGAHYQREQDSTRTMVNADAAIVLIQRGDSWLIRSWVERPRPPEP